MNEYATVWYYIVLYAGIVSKSTPYLLMFT